MGRFGTVINLFTPQQLVAQNKNSNKTTDEMDGICSKNGRKNKFIH
jgi:hypothetical protein